MPRAPNGKSGLEQVSPTATIVRTIFLIRTRWFQHWSSSLLEDGPSHNHRRASRKTELADLITRNQQEITDAYRGGEDRVDYHIKHIRGYDGVSCLGWHKSRALCNQLIAHPKPTARRARRVGTVARELAEMIAESAPPDARRLDELRMKLTSMLTRHLKTEDWLVFPAPPKATTRS